LSRNGAGQRIEAGRDERAGGWVRVGGSGHESGRKFIKEKLADAISSRLLLCMLRTAYT
jgi:hypothetical protein